MEMTPSRWQTVKELFDGTLEVPVEKREEFLRVGCGNDTDLRREIEALIEADQNPNSLLERPALGVMHSAAMAAFENSFSRIGSTIGNYRITEELAHGGMGIVYRAQHTSLPREVVLKCIRHAAFAPEIRQDLDARFLHEARIQAQLDHPNIVRVYEFFTGRSEYFLVMEYVPGQSLRQRLNQQRPLPESEAVDLAMQALEGLSHAHNLSATADPNSVTAVVHRDIKPANFMIHESGRLKLTDFGIAKILGDTEETKSGFSPGTAEYMSPEQINGLGVDPRSDIYSLGITLYEMLTGRVPFLRSDYNSTGEMKRAHSASSALPIRELNPAVTKQVAAVVEKALSKAPEDRWQTADEFRTALVTALEEASPTNWRRPAYFAATAVAILFTAVLAGRVLRDDYHPKAKVEKLYEQAQLAINESAPLRATALLERAVAEDGNFIAARALLGIAYAKTDQMEKARAALLDAANVNGGRWLHGRHEQALLGAAVAAVAKDFPKAASIYAELAGRTSGNERIFALLGQGAMQEQASKNDQARQTFDQVVKEDPRNVAALTRSAILLARNRRHADAIKMFDRAEAVERTDHNAEAFCDLLLARAQTMRGELGEREKRDLLRVLELSKTTGSRYHSLTAKFALADLKVRERDYEGAIEDTRSVSEEARREGFEWVAARATSDLGYALHYARKAPESISVLRDALRMANHVKSPSLVANAQIRLGEVLRGAGLVEESTAVTEPAIQWWRQHGSKETLSLLLLKWGDALYNVNRCREAEEAYLESRELAARYENSLYLNMALNRLVAFYGLRDCKRAWRYGEQAVSLARKTGDHTLIADSLSKLSRAPQNLGLARQTFQILDEAEMEYRMGLKDGPDLRERLATLDLDRAHTAWTTGVVQGISNIFRSKDHTNPEPENVLIHIADAYLQGGQKELADFEHAMEKTKNERARTSLSRWASEVALVARKFEAARKHAEFSRAGSVKRDEPVFQLHSSLVLRQVEHHAGNAIARDNLTTECLALAKRIGFDPPESFNGRKDFLRLWDLSTFAGIKPFKKTVPSLTQVAARN